MKYCVIALSLLLCLSSACGGSSNIDAQDDAALQKAVSLNLSSVGNARELGGYTTTDGKRVKHSTLLRTAALYNISSNDVTRLTDTYHLSVITDLRTSLEAGSNLDPVIDGVKYLNLHVINEEEFAQQIEKTLSFDGSPAERIRLMVDSGVMSYDLYITFLSNESGKRAYSEYFRELIDLPAGRSLLFHCTQGKDRTGCAAMLILSALGASEDTIMKDYMLTNIFNAELIDSQKKMLLSYGMEESELAKYMIALDEVNPKMMDTALSWLKETYGSPVGYILNELGVTEDEIAALKAKFLEED